MKQILHRLFEKMGLQIAKKKNLWYTDAYQIQQRLTTIPNPTIFDIGASEGSVTTLYKSLYPNATIHAFEPLPTVYPLLQQNTAQLHNVTTTNTAISDQNGSITFFETAENASSSMFQPEASGSFVDDHTKGSKAITVASTTLDTYCKNNGITTIDILKIDVQGAELKVLQGAQQLLATQSIKLIYAEIWFLACYEGQPLFHDIATYLKQYGYDVFGIYNVHNDVSINGRALWGDAIFVINK